MRDAVFFVSSFLLIIIVVADIINQMQNTDVICLKTLGYYNGEINELYESRVPMLDRACYFGDGVYNVAYCRHYNIFSLKEHVNQTMEGAEILGIKPDFTREELENILSELVRKVDSDEQRVYFQITRAAAERNHAFPKGENAKPNLWVMLVPKSLRDIYKPYKCITGEDKRFLYCNVKTLNLIPAVLEAEKAENAGADECILHRGEIVTECVHSNVSILKDDRLITHPANEYIYAGTRRAHLIKKCNEFGIPVSERPFTLDELRDADEILVTSGASLCMRVDELDGEKFIGKCPDTVRRIQDSLLKDFIEETE